MRRTEANDAAQMMNDIVREKAYLNGVKFIDIQAHFADEAGNYAAYGPDITGKQRLLREADGVLFTQAGNRKLAHLRRAGDQARPDAGQERAGHSAGRQRGRAEARQRAASRARLHPATAAGRARSRHKDGKARSRRPRHDPGSADAADPDEQKADNGRITLKSIGAGGREESVTHRHPAPGHPLGRGRA